MDRASDHFSQETLQMSNLFLYGKSEKLCTVLHFSLITKFWYKVGNDLFFQAAVDLKESSPALD